MGPGRHHQRAAATCLVLVALLAAGCTQVVGPARSFRAYERKAAATADSVLAAVRTAALVADGAAGGDLLAPATAVMLDETEAAASGAQATFDGIQPPDHRSDDLRRSLAPIVQRAVDQLSALRIEARRGELAGLGAHGPALSRIADDLDAFSEAHQ